jgi:hypothetical protein
VHTVDADVNVIHVAKVWIYFDTSSFATNYSYYLISAFVFCNPENSPESDTPTGSTQDFLTHNCQIYAETNKIQLVKLGLSMPQ